MADYSKGIFVIDLKTKSYSNLSPAPGSTMLGMDGLYFFKGTLLGVQNGVNPPRIVRLFLNAAASEVQRFEVLEANNPVFDEPTLGVLSNDSFFYIANSQWGTADQKGQLAPVEKLRDPVILKIGLYAAATGGVLR